MDVDQRIIMKNLRMVARDEAHAPHIGSQGIDLLHALRGLKAGLPAPQVKEGKFIRLGGRKLGVFEIHAAHPIALSLEEAHKMMADEPPGAGY